jgi:hypothetical protein
MAIVSRLITRRSDPQHKVVEIARTVSLMQGLTSRLQFCNL